MSGGPTAGGFDALAPGYDDDFGANPIGHFMRRRTWERMDARFEPGSRILEIGCGTGIDLVRLANRGHHVTGVDISPGMVETAREKVATAGLQDRAALLCADLTSDPLPEQLVHRAPYDALLSNFGALNCVGELPALSRLLHGLLRPGVPFLACLMTRPCPWETAYYLLRFQPGEAFRRHRRHGVEPLLGEHRVRTFYRSAGGYASIFSECFEVQRCLGLGVVLPPPYLKGLADRFPRLFRLAAGLERRIAHRWPFRLAADHILFEMSAREEPR